MAVVNVDGKQFEVEEGTRLVLALKDNDIDILHRCGGNARCTTCRVEFSEGEPEAMTAAERSLLDNRDLAGIARLSCQIECAGTMAVTPVMRLSTSDFDEPGSRPEDSITPPPEWT